MAEKEKRIPEFMQPMQGAAWFKPEQCKDCIFRDRTSVKLDGEVKHVGAGKSVCDIYEYPDMKPMGVMNNTETCKFYDKE